MFVTKVIIYDHGKEFNFFDGINIISNTNGFDFDAIAFGLGLIPAKVNKEFDFDINSITGSRASVDIEVNINGETIKWERRYNGSRIDYQRDNKVNLKTNPIVQYFSGKSIDVINFDYSSKNCNPNFNALDNLYKTCMRDNSFYYTQQEWGNLFIERFKMLASRNTNNARYEFLNFHCENLKRIVNEMIETLEFHDFNFNIAKRCFTHKKNNLTFSGFKHNALPYLIYICAELYLRSLVINKDKFGDRIIQDKGVAIINQNFGERPSYSDNKWKYYNCLRRNFPNIQLIAI